MTVHSARGYSVGVGKRHISVAWKSSDYFSTLNTESKLGSMTTRQWDVSYTSDGPRRFVQWLNCSARGGRSLYRREAWRVDSRGGVPDRQPGVFEHSMHSLWLSWHLIVFDACNIYPHQAWTNANDKMTVKGYIFFYKTSCIEKDIQM